MLLQIYDLLMKQNLFLDLGFEYEIDLEKGLQDLISWRSN